ncbi:LPD1 domain-containing protein [Bacillus sp. SM2101]|uniref:LPD1 domain-containing protein n=1 Tax=Bacillus sp. SM2101 TaxID=2805366 RepID=UPI001BDF4A21|nr:LPD1 domain-containing protein [Bacillus sp. SM2101]
MSEKRITTVSKKQLFKENLEQKGLSVQLGELLQGTSIKVDEKDAFTKLLRAVKRKVNNQLEKMDVEEVTKYLDEISFGSCKVEIIDRLESINQYSQIELVSICAGIIKRRSKDIVKEIIEKYSPIEIGWKDCNGFRTGLSITNKPIKKNYHNTRRSFRSCNDYHYLFDLGSVIAETLVMNSLEQFAKRNEKMMQYLLTKKMIGDHPLPESLGKGVFIPKDDVFSKDVRIIIEECKLAEGLKIVESTYLDTYKKYFYISELEDFAINIRRGSFYKVVVKEFLSQLHFIKDKTDRQYSSRTDYARSFETKKQINKKQQEAMKDNAFLDRYQYVEIDNEVLFRDEVNKMNLTSNKTEKVFTFEDLEEEFVRFVNQVYVPFSEGSFRIKRLGKLRAAGVYYPHVNATIIDREHPESYSHELGHMLDYCLSDTPNAPVSESFAFRSIIDLYTEAVCDEVNELPDDHYFKKQWHGKSKFNKSYFIQPTEIFARSFELYLWNKGIRSSFLKKSYTEKPEYPQDVDYINRIAEYFNQLFSYCHSDAIPIKGRIIAISQAEPRLTHFEIKTCNEDNSRQLTLF